MGLASSLELLQGLQQHGIGPVERLRGAPDDFATILSVRRLALRRRREGFFLWSAVRHAGVSVVAPGKSSQPLGRIGWLIRRSCPGKRALARAWPSSPPPGPWRESGRAIPAWRRPR